MRPQSRRGKRIMEKRTQHVNLFRAGQPMQIMCSIHSEDRPGKWGEKTCE